MFTVILLVNTINYFLIIFCEDVSGHCGEIAEHT